MGIAIGTIIAITSVFMYAVRPNAVIVARGAERKIDLIHEGGESVSWGELRISVTRGKNSEPVFRDPSTPEHALGSENRNLASIYEKFRKDLTVSIFRTSLGKELIPRENEYHVVIKHYSTDITMTNMNTLVQREGKEP